MTGLEIGFMGGAVEGIRRIYNAVKGHKKLNQRIGKFILCHAQFEHTIRSLKPELLNFLVVDFTPCKEAEDQDASSVEENSPENQPSAESDDDTLHPGEVDQVGSTNSRSSDDGDGQDADGDTGDEETTQSNLIALKELCDSICEECETFIQSFNKIGNQNLEQLRRFFNSKDINNKLDQLILKIETGKEYISSVALLFTTELLSKIQNDLHQVQKMQRKVFRKINEQVAAQRELFAITYATHEITQHILHKENQKVVEKSVSFDLLLRIKEDIIEATGDEYFFQDIPHVLTRETIYDPIMLSRLHKFRDHFSLNEINILLEKIPRMIDKLINENDEQRLSHYLFLQAVNSAVKISFKVTPSIIDEIYENFKKVAFFLPAHQRVALFCMVGRNYLYRGYVKQALLYQREAMACLQEARNLPLLSLNHITMHLNAQNHIIEASAQYEILDQMLSSGFNLLSIDPYLLTTNLFSSYCQWVLSISQMLDQHELLGEHQKVNFFYEKYKILINQFLSLFSRSLLDAAEIDGNNYAIVVDKAHPILMQLWRHQQYGYAQKFCHLVQVKSRRVEDYDEQKYATYEDQLADKAVCPEQITPRIFTWFTFQNQWEIEQAKLESCLINDSRRFDAYIAFDQQIFAILQRTIQEIVPLLGPIPCEFTIVISDRSVGGTFDRAEPIKLVIGLSNEACLEYPYFGALLKLIDLRLLITTGRSHHYQLVPKQCEAVASTACFDGIVANESECIILYTTDVSEIPRKIEKIQSYLLEGGCSQEELKIYLSRLAYYSVYLGSDVKISQNFYKCIPHSYQFQLSGTPFSARAYYLLQLKEEFNLKNMGHGSDVVSQLSLEIDVAGRSVAGDEYFHRFQQQIESLPESHHLSAETFLILWLNQKGQICERRVDQSIFIDETWSYHYGQYLYFLRSCFSDEDRQVFAHRLLKRRHEVFKEASSCESMVLYTYFLMTLFDWSFYFGVTEFSVADTISALKTNFDSNFHALCHYEAQHPPSSLLCGSPVDWLARDCVNSIIMPTLFSCIDIRGKSIIDPLHYYKTLSLEERRSYYHSLKSAGERPELQEICFALSDRLGRFPGNNGYRVVVHEEEQKNWEMQLDKILVQHQALDVDLPKIRLSLPGRSKGFLHPNIIRHLIHQGWMKISGDFVDKQSQPTFHDKKLSGAHRTIPVEAVEIDGKLYSFFIKVYPESPGIEYAVASWHQLLMGGGTPRSEFARFQLCGESLDNIIADYPLLISELVVGEPLHSIVDADWQSKLNPKQLLQMLFVAMFIQDEDKKPDNILLCHDISTHGYHYKFCLTDNERGYSPDVHYDEKSNQFMLIFKHFLFFLDIAHAPIFYLGMTHNERQLVSEMIDEFLTLDPKEVLNYWLNDLVNKEQSYRALYTPQEISQLRPKENWFTALIKRKNESESATAIEVSLLRSTIGHFYYGLISLREFLSHVENTREAPIDFLKKMSLFSYRYYKRNFNLGGTPHERWGNGPGQYYIKEENRLKSGALVSNRMSNRSKINVSEPSLFARPSFYGNFHHALYSPLEKLEEDLALVEYYYESFQRVDEENRLLRKLISMDPVTVEYGIIELSQISFTPLVESIINRLFEFRKKKIESLLPLQHATISWRDSVITAHYKTRSMRELDDFFKNREHSEWSVLQSQQPIFQHNLQRKLINKVLKQRAFRRLLIPYCNSLTSQDIGAIFKMSHHLCELDISYSGRKTIESTLRLGQITLEMLPHLKETLEKISMDGFCFKAFAMEAGTELGESTPLIFPVLSDLSLRNTFFIAEEFFGEVHLQAPQLRVLNVSECYGLRAITTGSKPTIQLDDRAVMPIIEGIVQIQVPQGLSQALGRIGVFRSAIESGVAENSVELLISVTNTSNVHFMTLGVD